MSADKPKSRRRTLLIIAGALVVLIFGCGLLAAIFGDSPPAEETAQPTATLAAPTEPPTVAPTAIPTEPPPTAEPPTSTPQPTATVESNSDAEAESLYRSQMAEIAGLFTKSLQGLTTQSGAAGEDPSLMLNDDWKIKTAVYLSGLTVASQSLRELDPPARFSDVHAEMLEAADYYELVAKYYAEGVDELNADKLTLAATNMTLGNMAVKRATDNLAMIGMP